MNRSSSSSSMNPTPPSVSTTKKSVEFVAVPAASSQSATEQKIISAVQRLQDLVNQEVKWRNRVIGSVQTCSTIDLSTEKMNEFINQCKTRINSLREEAAKIADKQLHLVSFEPAVYRQWFEQVGSDPLTITPPPIVIASCNQALTGSPAGDKNMRAALAGGGGAAPKKVAKSGGAQNAAQLQQQYLDGIPLPEKFWRRREQQRQALANVYLAIFDLPRLHREKPGSKPTTAAEMVYQLQEAVRLSASGPPQLRELLKEYRNKERDVAAGLFNAMTNLDGTTSGGKPGDKAGGGAGAAAAANKLRQQQQRQAAAAAASVVAGNSARGRPSSGSARGKGGGGGGDPDLTGEPITAKSCLQTGVFIHDPQADELALSTELRAGDFFDVGSPRCLDQRFLHRVMTLRSRRLRLEECVAVFDAEKLELGRRTGLQREMTGLSQYALFATKPEIERTIAEEKTLQKKKQDEAEARKIAEKHGLLMKKAGGKPGSGGGATAGAEGLDDLSGSFNSGSFSPGGTVGNNNNDGSATSNNNNALHEQPSNARTNSTNASPSFANSKRR